VRALTGTDPDRLKEEQQRGITIDLGFAHLDLGGGRVASFVDVPGHERFVKNMLAGAHGIDAALLVVAADESVMPQTREHFHICRLLGVQAGLVALTKCDVADAELQKVAELEARELSQGSFLDGAPLLRVSARTGAGLPQRVDALRELDARIRARPAAGLLRLPIDRVFTLKGFGTVVTGTLVAGTLELGEELEALPSGKRGRVRGLQVHGEVAARVCAGNRAAVNLAGLETSELARGDVLARPGTLLPTSMLDVEITLLADARPLKDQARVRVHLASAERLARVRVLDGAQIAPGARGVAQLRLESPGVAGRGDRLILRAYSPAATIGGAQVLDPLPKKRARSTDPQGLRALADVPPGEAARRLVAAAGTAGVRLEELGARLVLPVDELRRQLAEQASLVVIGGAAIARTSLDALARAALDRLGSFHEQSPLRAAMPREELRRQVFAGAAPGAFDHVVERLASLGTLKALADALALAGHSVTLSDAEARARGALLAALQGAGLSGLLPAEAAAKLELDARILERVAKLLLQEGLLARVGGDGRLVHAEHLARLKVLVRERWPPGTHLDVAGFKDLTGLSRKFVIPLLEYLDRERVTRRAGQDRLVLTAPA
jgi:selenocysteine-specific elongation factor